MSLYYGCVKAGDPDGGGFAGRVVTARQLADAYVVADVDGSWSEEDTAVIARYRYEQVRCPVARHSASVRVMAFVCCCTGRTRRS